MRMRERGRPCRGGAAHLGRPWCAIKNRGRRPDALRRLRPRHRSPCWASARRHASSRRRPLHRMDAASAREKPPPRDRQSAVPHPALDHDSQPGLAVPLSGPPATTRGLHRAVQHGARAHRDLRRDPALHRRALQGVRLDPRRNHQGTGPMRPTHQTRSTEEEHLAPTPAEGLAAHSQPVRSCSFVTLDGHSPPGDRTKTESDRIRQ